MADRDDETPTPPDAERARQAAERVARLSYGRLVAFLAARSRNIALAEDALADAFRTALDVWPRRGIPDKPEAWLLTAARRNLSHAGRHDRVRAGAEATIEMLAEELGAEELGAEEDRMIPDDRLKLMFVCAHPAIDSAAQTPLMLQTVLGVDAARIAAAFLVPAATMSQRLVRAKTKIRDAGIAFKVPESQDLVPRLDAVLSAIYGAYGAGWDDGVVAGIGEDRRRSDLAPEAIWLGRVLVTLLPAEPEARGLLALMLHCEARRPARRSPAGAFVPLDEQDTRLWHRPSIEEAESHLAIAARAGRLGRFQLEAAIQSAHNQRAAGGQTPWPAIRALYRALVEIAPTIGAEVSAAAVEGRLGNGAEGLARLDTLPADRVERYQPYWVARGHLLAQAGRAEESADCYRRALGLTDDPAVRAFLMRKAVARAAEDQ